MMKVPYYDSKGVTKGTLEVDESLFNSKVKKRLLRDVVIMYEANKRQGTSSTKGRSEVAGTSKKPWKQKHTGRARFGTIRNPIWRHGGIAFGPKPRDYSCVIPKKMRRAALDSALLAKIIDNEVAVVDEIDITVPKTKEISTLLKNVGFERTVLIGVGEYNKAFYLSARNIKGTYISPVSAFNAYDVLKYKNILLTKKAFDNIVELRTSGDKK